MFFVHVSVIKIKSNLLLIIALYVFKAERVSLMRKCLRFVHTNCITCLDSFLVWVKTVVGFIIVTFLPSGAIFPSTRFLFLIQETNLKPRVCFMKTKPQTSFVIIRIGTVTSVKDLNKSIFNSIVSFMF